MWFFCGLVFFFPSYTPPPQAPPVKDLPCPFCEVVSRFSVIAKNMDLGLMCIHWEIWILSHTLLKNALWMLHIYSSSLPVCFSPLSLGSQHLITNPFRPQTHQILFRAYSGHSSWAWSNLSFLWGALTDFYGKPKGQMACSMPEWSD